MPDWASGDIQLGISSSQLSEERLAKGKSCRLFSLDTLLYFVSLQAVILLW